MPRIITENSAPREYVVHYNLVGERRPNEVVHGVNADGALDSGLFNRKAVAPFLPAISILPYGVAVWGMDRGDSRTVIPWHNVVKIEEVF